VVVISLALVAAGIWRIDGVMGALGLAGLAWIGFARWRGGVNLARIHVAMDGPERVTAGIPFPLRFTVTNGRRWLDARHLDLRATLPGEAPAEFHCRWIAAGSAADFDARTTATTRANGGEIRVVVVSGLSSAWFKFRREIRIPSAMVVLPRVRAPRRIPEDGMMLDGSPLSGATAGSAGGDLRGLREWRAGDSPRLISWPASIRAFAQGGPLVVRETDPPGFLPRACLVVLHSFASGGALIRPERFERALELAGGWMERLHAMGIRTRIIADFDGWVPRPAATREEIIHCREMLARARRSNSSEAHELQQAVGECAAGGETLVLISDMPASSWRDHLPPRPSPPRIVDF
jgi:uncharacterized protein (DUF58 family)